MFNKLFGGKKEAPKPQTVDISAANEKLAQKVEDIEMRCKKLENQMNEQKALAMQKKKAKDNNGAINALRKAKMYEKQLATMQGQQIMLEQ